MAVISHIREPIESAMDETMIGHLFFIKKVKGNSSDTDISHISPDLKK